jgi:hypothetical protein
VAVLAGGGPGGGRVFRGRGEVELARLSEGPDGVRVAFAADLVNPFVKMLLLAAALGEG